MTSYGQNDSMAGLMMELAEDCTWRRTANDRALSRFCTALKKDRYGRKLVRGEVLCIKVLP